MHTFLRLCVTFVPKLAYGVLNGNVTFFLISQFHLMASRDQKYDNNRAILKYVKTIGIRFPKPNNMEYSKRLYELITKNCFVLKKFKTCLEAFFFPFQTQT